MPALGSRGSRQKHSLPDLPYDYGALEPHISAQIMQLHHSKHHATYVNNLNAVEEKYLEALEKGRCGAAGRRARRGRGGARALRGGRAAPRVPASTRGQNSRGRRSFCARLKQACAYLLVLRLRYCGRIRITLVFFPEEPS